MSLPPLRLGTRSSRLALWQAHHVADLLRDLVAPRLVTIVTIETHGDLDQSSRLASMGGFGVFTKAISQALQENRVDLAVHSLKDLPTIPTEGLMLAGTPPRGPVADAFVSRKHRRFEALPQGAIVGTSSLRRRAHLLNRRPDLQLVDLRGNVETRLAKLEKESLDAIVLAEAGLVRLGLSAEITERLDSSWMLPAVGQGIIGLECREGDEPSRLAARAITDEPTWRLALAERALLAALGGGCLLPLGVTSSLEGTALTLRGSVLSENGNRRIVATHSGDGNFPLAIGQETAAMLLDEGAGELLGV